jgi:nucleoside-diphosphate-sugar epimerase
VHAVVRRADDDPLVTALTPHVHTLRHDGSTAGLARIVAAAKPAVVFHLASRFVAEHGSIDVEPLVRDNVVFGAQLLEAMRDSGVTRLVNAGSAWRHFVNREYSPINLYAASKQAFLDVLAYYVEAYEFHVVTLDLTDVYGRGDTRRKLMPALLAAERDGRTLSMVRADLPMDFVHVNDAARAFVVAARRVLESRRSGHDVFAVRSGAPIAVRDLFAVWETARGVTLKANWGERALRAREATEPWTQGTALPGWSPAVRLEDGLKSL